METLLKIKRGLVGLVPLSLLRGIKRATLPFLSVLFRNNLTALMIIHGTDKVDPYRSHRYSKLYEKYLIEFRDKPITMLEIGVLYGNSLRMWKSYLPQAKLYGLDLFCMVDGFKVFQGSQSDVPFLNEVLKETGKLDFVIDDGSHIQKDAIISFKTLFPHVSLGGVYVVEDIQVWSKEEVKEFVETIKNEAEVHDQIIFIKKQQA
ncbi:MAG: class I SAM-dependent methyltransferase [Patescibacteria group bacterium]